MFAVVKAGGKQYTVRSNDLITINKMEGSAGDRVTLSEVVMIGGEKARLGIPFVQGASVITEIVEQKRGDKVLVFKKKRRQNYRRRKGHRQYLTTLKVLEIKV